MMAETKAPAKKEKEPTEVVTSNDARFSTVQPVPQKDLAPGAGRSLIEVRGEPKGSVPPSDSKES